jgi:putative oxidoreductase
MSKLYFSLVLRLIAAVILGQTLFFKFTGAEESVWIFEQLGAEPWGRLGSGIAELVCAVLLLIPRTAFLGALGGLGVISGAIFSHLFILGIEVKGDGGLLFGLALVVFICCASILWMQRDQLKLLISQVFNR